MLFIGGAPRCTDSKAIIFQKACVNLCVKCSLVTNKTNYNLVNRFHLNMTWHLTKHGRQVSFCFFSFYLKGSQHELMVILERHDL